MPGQTDLYFPPEDSAAEVRVHVECDSENSAVLSGGISAALAINPVDTDFIDQAVKECLAE